MAERAQTGAGRSSARAQTASRPRVSIASRPIGWPPNRRVIGADGEVAGRRAPLVRHPPAAALARPRRAGVELYHELEGILEARGQTLEDVIRTEGQHQAAAQAGMANLITSLRLISTFDWSEFFENVSLVEQVLQRDPAGVYGRMDFRSRDRYRHAVEELASPTGEAQLLLALKSVERARQVHVKTPDARAAHVGYHLIGGGRREFERSIAWRPTVRLRLTRFSSGGRRRDTSAQSPRARRFWFHWPWAMRGSTDGAAPVWSSSHSDRRPGQRADDSSPAAADQLPDSSAAAAPHRAHLRAAIGAHDGHRADASRQRRSCGGFDRPPGVQALGNLDPHIHFALLTDFLDAPAETLPHDQEILDAAREGSRLECEARGRRVAFLPVSPVPAVEPARRPVDGMGTQAREDRVQPPAARRHRHELCRLFGDLDVLPDVRNTASRSTAIRGCHAASHAS